VIVRTDGLEPRQAYRLMTSVVVPRPIAWITSVGADGTVNLAPYSYFNGVTSRPPIIAVSIAQRRGTPKDTARNIESTGAFVVNVVDEAHAELMNRSATEYPYGVSEVSELGLELVPGETVDVPRLAGVPAALECRLLQTVPVGDPPVAHVLGRVTAVALAETVAYDPDQGVDVETLHPVGRLGQNRYTFIRELFEMDRIPYPPPGKD
jgi:flavin reductase (DIM6/NTAB) family NADH-FMN oxidoreductase RutF